MGLTIYKRGKFWWLTGDIAGKRVHESTGQTIEANADKIRLRMETEGLGLAVDDPRTTINFAQAVTAFVAAGNDVELSPELLEFLGGISIRELPYVARATAKLLYPDAEYTTWNKLIVTPVQEIVEQFEESGVGPTITVKPFTWLEGESYKRDRQKQMAARTPKDT